MSESKKTKWASVARLPMMAAATTLVAVGSLAVPTAAHAATSATPTASAAPSRAASATHSETDAGYGALQTEGLASASATITVPRGSCGSSTAALQFGVFAGHGFSSIDLSCATGSPVYTYDLDTPAEPIVEPAAFGDTVVTMLFETSQVIQAEVHDLTNGQYWVDSTDEAGTDTGAIFGLASNDPAPIPSFAKTTFKSLQMNGDNIGFYGDDQQGEALTQLNLVPDRHTLVSTSGLSANGTSFVATFKQAE